MANALDDPRALQILTTEHWSLLSARSLVYNEAFARAGMSSVPVGDARRARPRVDGDGLLRRVPRDGRHPPDLDLFIGLTSLGRIGAAGDEDLRYLQGMNRLRHAYHEMVPGLDRYFITSPYDDFDSMAPSMDLPR